MRTDIQNRQDIEKLVNTFYDKVKTDETIGYFFTKVIPVDWEVHLPKMYDFWENILFNSTTYKGNPIEAHQHVHKESPMLSEHFTHWVKLFTHTVEENFVGKNAESIIQRATSIATVMQIKVIH